MDFDAAAEALAGVNNGEVAPPAVTPAEQAPVPSLDSTETVEAGTTPGITEESFTNVDLDSLDPQVKAVAEQTLRNLQADYTRKMQEIAPLRKLDVDPETAAQAVEFVSRLNDPEFQKSLYERLSDQFGSEDLYDDEEQGDPRDRQIQALESKLGSFEQKMVEKEAAAELDRMEAIVRSSNPDFDDEDMKQVAMYSLYHEGDLVKGADTYKSELQRVLGRHLAKKEAVPAAAHVPGSGHAEVPANAPSDPKEVHAAAMRMFLAEQGA